MSIVFILIAWRVWLIVTAVLLLNAASRLMFKPSKALAKDVARSIPFIAVWPIAMFSPQGRKKIFIRIKGV